MGKRVTRAGKRDETLEIACQQILLPDASVFSIQWLDMAERHGDLLLPPRLLARYLDHVRRCTLSLIRPLATAAGIEFRLLGTRVSLLTFAPPHSDDRGPVRTTTLRICGGVLVQAQQCDRGQLVFRTEPVPAGTRITLELSDYCPLLLGSPAPSPVRKLLYRLTQACIHKVVTVNYLARLYRELVGNAGKLRVVKVNVEQGEDI